MIDGLIKAFRMYCRIDTKTAAEATGIALYRYKKLEAGEAIPSDKELEKIAALFGVNEDILNGNIDENDFFGLRQPIDENLFASEDLRAQMKLRITDLTPEEKKLILLIRCCDNSDAVIHDAICRVLENQ